MSAILNSLNAHNFPIDETGIKIHGLKNPFLLNVLIIRVAVPFKLQKKCIIEVLHR